MTANNNTTQQGFISLLLVIMVGLLIIAGGVMVWQGQRQQTAGTKDTSATKKTSQTGTKIVAVGDISCQPGEEVTPTTCQMQKVVDAIVSEKPVHVLALGDLQYDSGAPQAFEAAFKPLWEPLRDITYATPGNHEYATDSAAGYFGYWNGSGTESKQAGQTGKGFYSTDIGAWHVISLNSNCDDVGGCGEGSEQATWLAADLAGSTATCTLAFWHHPRFTSGRHNNATNTATFWDTLYAKKADVVLNGHDHVYERFARQTPAAQVDTVRGIREFVAGAGGKSLYKFKSTLQPNHEAGNDSDFGYMVLTLYPSSYAWEYKTVSGAVVDQGSSSCSQ